MRRIICSTLCISMLCMVTVPALAQKASCFDSHKRGQLIAKDEHTVGGWFLGGLALGTAGGLIGALVLTGFAANSTPMPGMLPSDTEVDIGCYINGYQKDSKGKNTKAAIVGGILGSVICTVIYLNVADHPFEF